ncbi:MAG: hypothetical protein AABX35_00800 [Nanoarchaeota archaeon]
MSQIEQDFRQFMAKRPEIGKCYKSGLINRRSLARYLIDNKLAKGNQLEAVIAMLRRYDFGKSGVHGSTLDIKRTTMKDNILILDFEKQKEFLKELQRIITHIDYDQGDTLKVVVGSSSIKLFIDKQKESELKDIISRFKLKRRFDKISELSLIFGEEPIDSKGILSLITQELLIHDIVVVEMLTSSPELILYLKEDDVLKAYDVIKELRKSI